MTRPALLAVTLLLVAACGGPAAPSAPSATTSQPNISPSASAQPAGSPTTATGPGGVRVNLVLGGGPHEGSYDLTHSNPCRKGNPSAGAWALTTTFPGAATGPSIVDLVLLEASSYVEVYFGNEVIRADDVQFSVDDRGETATLTASGDASPAGGESYAVDVSVECDTVATYR